jgi:hypothetical protein
VPIDSKVKTFTLAYKKPWQLANYGGVGIGDNVCREPQSLKQEQLLCFFNGILVVSKNS